LRMAHRRVGAIGAIRADELGARVAQRKDRGVRGPVPEPRKKMTAARAAPSRGNPDRAGRGPTRRAADQATRAVRLADHHGGPFAHDWPNGKCRRAKRSVVDELGPICGSMKRVIAGAGRSRGVIGLIEGLGGRRFAGRRPG